MKFLTLEAAFSEGLAWTAIPTGHIC